MKKFELNVIEKLIDIYEQLYAGHLTKEVSEKAKLIYDELTPGHILLGENVNLAVGRLFDVAYPNIDPDRKMPTKKEIDELINNLKKTKQELIN